MKDSQSLYGAEKHYGATNIKSFGQLIMDGDTGSCVGYVSAWLRKRSTGKDFWDAAHFTSVGALKRYQRFVEMDDLKGITLAKQRQAIFPGDRAAERAYITSGKKGKVTLRHVGADAGFITPMGNENTFKALLRVVGQNHYLASIGIRIGNGELAHALGVDCSGATCVYFDPALGELTFPTISKLSTWWHWCFKDRANKGTDKRSAWHQMDDSRVTIESYAVV